MRLFFRKCFYLVKSRRRSISSCVMDIHPEVGICLRENKPVVALESTIITHGMPYPHNLSTAKSCQEIIRKEGCVPAVIAVLNGRVKVGLSEEQLDYLARGGLGKTVKTSRRDFPYVLANKLDGGTTVSGTVIVAHAVGIKVFATGGIGGVHRRGQETMDISADLKELGRNPIMVVSSGVKSILDIGKTLEYLETQGVLVSTYRSDCSMPAFFSRDSSFKTPYNVDSSTEAASLIKGMMDMKLDSGILLAVPIPQEHSIDYELMETHINEALKEAENKKITGKEVTPYLLDKINSLTKGKSLKSNIALIENNSKVAAQIAHSYAEMTSSFSEILSNNSFKQPKIKIAERNPVVVGGSVVDYTVGLDNVTKLDGRTVKAEMDEWCGGVGRNIADALGKLGSNPSFVSTVAADRNGQTVLNSLSHIDRQSVEVLDNERTASFMVLLNHRGECLICAGDSSIHDKMDSEQVKRHLLKIENSNFIILDSNIPEEVMEFVIDFASNLWVPIWVEPTSLLKCCKVLNCPSVESVSYVSPNLIELKQMSSHFGSNLDDEFDFDDIDKLLKQVLFLCESLSQNIPSTLMVTMGKYGTLMVPKQSINSTANKFSARYYPVMNKSDEIVNSSGAGDCGAAGYITGLLRNYPEASCVHLAHLASRASLTSKSPVPDQFTDVPDKVEYANFITLSV